ncbi:class I SAM-dependent methyltransferase [Pseudonocardia acaciae]|uniref:class I SAM-dependent methyltransferase n=1 Tax=Pseudonocardia acaciae TaxID=551276 RepID=UPI0006887106|nr:class I SAM-dependent methyltransferase [Pseudonocardia acaciae]
MTAVLRKLTRTIREDGPRALAAKIVSKLSDHAFDVRHGTDTCRWVRLSGLSVPEHARAHGTDYQPTGTAEFRRLMAAIDPPRSGAFVDFGSGKGRVVLMAARYGFRRVIGVELSEELCAVARTNIATFRARVAHTSPMEIVTTDAAHYDVPDDTGVVFLFNPFDEVVVTHVLRSVEESHRRLPRPIHLIYSNAAHGSLIDHSPLFTDRSQHNYPRAHFTVYRSCPDRE